MWLNVHGDEFVWDEFVGDELFGDGFVPDIQSSSVSLSTVSVGYTLLRLFSRNLKFHVD